MFYLSKTGSLGSELPNEKEKHGKQDGSLALTVGANEKKEKDGDSPIGPE